MGNPEPVDRDTAEAWSIVDHICRACGGRVLVTADGARVRCADCSAEAAGGPENLCWCGALPAGSRVRLRCVRNEHPTPALPCRIVAIECGDDAATTPSDIAYLQVDGCDRRFFRCQALRSTLSVEGCAANWRRAQRISAEELGLVAKCRDCRIGAAHAGERHVHHSKIFDLGICPRCRRGGSRMIGRRLCVSDYNREREVKIGLNAKKTRPQLVLEPRRLGVVLGYGDADQRYVEVRDEFTRDGVELALQVLATVSGRVAFCKPHGGRAISTIELAPERSPARGLIAHAVAKPGLRKSRQALPVDRMPNEHRNQPQPNVIDGGVPLVRDLAMGIVS